MLINHWWTLFSKYTSLGVSTITGPIGSLYGINDPDYASYEDYKNGITRCDINPYDPSCNKKPDDNTDSGNGDSDGNITKPDENVGNSGSGGGSGSGNVESNGDGNGDVVGAIDRFHADNNANHKQLLDELKRRMITATRLIKWEICSQMVFPILRAALNRQLIH